MLIGVLEMMLVILYGRVVEVMCEDVIIKDEKVIEIYNLIDYDYEVSFGILWWVMYIGFVIRLIIFDWEINKFLSIYFDGIIVNLGEGLEIYCFWIVKE